MNITTSFIPSGCTGYVQVLDVAINKPLKDRISELADLSYEENLQKWENGKYTVGDRRVMLTHWVGQAWRELHKDNGDLIRQTFRKLGLSLTVDGSEDTELKIRDLPNIEVGDWHLEEDEEEVQPDDPVEIDEATGMTHEGDSMHVENEVIDEEEGGEELDLMEDEEDNEEDEEDEEDGENDEDENEENDDNDDD